MILRVGKEWHIYCLEAYEWPTCHWLAYEVDPWLSCPTEHWGVVARWCHMEDSPSIETQLQGFFYCCIRWWNYLFYFIFFLFFFFFFFFGWVGWKFSLLSKPGKNCCFRGCRGLRNLLLSGCGGLARLKICFFFLLGGGGGGGGVGRVKSG